MLQNVLLPHTFINKSHSNSPTRAKASPKHAQVKKRSAGCLETQTFTAPAFQPGSMPILDDMEGSLALPVSLPTPTPTVTLTPTEVRQLLFHGASMFHL